MSSLEDTYCRHKPSAKLMTLFSYMCIDSVINSVILKEKCTSCTCESCSYEELFYRLLCPVSNSPILSVKFTLLKILTRLAVNCFLKVFILDCVFFYRLSDSHSLIQHAGKGKVAGIRTSNFTLEFADQEWKGKIISAILYQYLLCSIVF